MRVVSENVFHCRAAKRSSWSFVGEQVGFKVEESEVEKDVQMGKDKDVMNFDDL